MRHRQTPRLALDAVVQGDARGLDRVLANLIDNAVRHTPAGGVVTVGDAHWSGFRPDLITAIAAARGTTTTESRPVKASGPGRGGWSE